MGKKLQWSADTTINAPLSKVWEYCMDISKIPDFHPLVSKVDYISGTTKREIGVSYRCNITEGKGKGTCVEKISELIPFEKFTTVIPEDSWGIGRMFKNYTAETLFYPINHNTTKVTINAYYEPAGIKAKLINPLAARKMRKQAADTLNGIRKAIENDH